MKAVRPDVGGYPPRRTSQSYSTCKMLGTIIFWRNGGKYPPISRYLLGCPCKLVTIVRKLVYFTYLRDLRALLIKG